MVGSSQAQKGSQSGLLIIRATLLLPPIDRRFLYEKYGLEFEEGEGGAMDRQQIVFFLNFFYINDVEYYNN